MLFDLGLPSFSTLIHNSKVSLASRLSVCDNDIVRRVLWVCFVSFSLSVCVCSFFCICMCYAYVYGPQLSEINKWMNEFITGKDVYARTYMYNVGLQWNIALYKKLSACKRRLIVFSLTDCRRCNRKLFNNAIQGNFLQQIVLQTNYVPTQSKACQSWCCQLCFY